MTLQPFFTLFLLWFIKTRAEFEQSPANEKKPYASILYTAVLDGKVALPCDVSSPSPDDSAALILWYKDDSAQPIYTLDARRGNVDHAHQSSSPELESRAYFNMINRPAFLQLDPVKEDDAGEYRCRVDFHKARTVNTVITLKIIVPPGEPVILDEQGQSLKGLVGPYNEGDSLTVMCQAKGGKPRPTVTWWRDYSLLDGNYTFELGDIVQNQLKLDRLHRQDLLAVLTCQASNNNITVPASNAITIDLNLKPEKAVITTSQKPLVADKEIELTCTAKGSRPASKISWWKGNQQMQNTRESALHSSDTTTILTFTPSIDDNGNFLSCRAENPLIVGSAVEDGWRLDVQYPPQVSLQLGTNLKVSNIQEGNDVYFECNVRANPWIHELSWQFEGQDLTTNTSAGIIISNQSLVLQKVQRSFRGRFTCSGTNSQGLGISNEIFLKVKYAPFCKPGQKTTYGVAKHEPLDVSCELDSDPDDVKVHWRFNSSYKRSDKIIFSADRAHSIATYTPESDEDYGKLLCWGTNDIGIQSEPCVFTIVPAGPPDPLHNCSLVNQTEDLISIHCLEGYDGGMPQRFILEVYSINSNTLQANITSPAPVFLADELPSGTPLRIVMYAANPKGRSSSVVMPASTLRPAEKLTRRGDGEGIFIIRPFLAILIAIVAVLVIIALVLAIFIRSKWKRRMKGQLRRNIPESEKSEMPLKKDVEDLGEIENTGPDIIPDKGITRSPFADCMDEKDQRCLQLSNTVEDHSIHSPKRDHVEVVYSSPVYTKSRLADINSPKIISATTQPEDIPYVDLSFPTGQCLTAVMRRQPLTEYAKIDLTRGKEEAYESSLMKNSRESAV
ncbi:hemicentin-1-like isoform X3 [Limulus polyphemus]|uniref:Hemicentin-1-like isoform X3 n=1 Tax=Limulus polyphemus TaxID=6850 RepID=A0ABM1TK15_LIMPO|nr:hemicentin-1-like isoform X3 [Limulus polyphemus]